jgi:hypothetical protein
MIRMQLALGIAAGGVAMALLAGGRALASRCGDQNPARCGLDAQTDPATLPGGTGGCTEASMATLPLFKGTGQCAPGETAVIYDLGTTFPDNGLSGDQAVVGETSFITLRAGTSAPCAQMLDTVDPKPCPDPQECPNSSTQPPGAIKVAVTGYMVGCWSKQDRNGCRDLRVYSGGSVCLHAQHELLGPGCTTAGSVDCANVSTEQIAFDEPGGSNRRLCPPVDPDTSCRGTRHKGEPGLRFRIGGFCSTNNCANPGTAPDIDPERTCKVAWGATNLGYDRPPGKGINQPGWYDWKTGSLKVDLSSPKPTCGDLGVCLGERTGQPWDLRIVAVPRPGQAAPCLGNPLCDAPGCFGGGATTTTAAPTTTTTESTTSTTETTTTL